MIKSQTIASLFRSSPYVYARIPVSGYYSNITFGMVQRGIIATLAANGGDVFAQKWLSYMGSLYTTATSTGGKPTIKNDGSLQFDGDNDSIHLSPNKSENPEIQFKFRLNTATNLNCWIINARGQGLDHLNYEWQMFQYQGDLAFSVYDQTLGASFSCRIATSNYDRHSLFEGSAYLDRASSKIVLDLAINGVSFYRETATPAALVLGNSTWCLIGDGGWSPGSFFAEMNAYSFKYLDYVTKDVLFDLRTPPMQNVHFVITSGGNTVEGASITLGDLTLTSDLRGRQQFVMPAGIYNYTIEKTGYIAQSGSVTVAGAAQQITITLLPI